MPLVAISVVALIAAGCGGGTKKTADRSRGKSCGAAIGIAAPTTGRMAGLGDEQLAFAKIAVANDNKANRTHISLVPGNTQLTPTLATTATKQLIGNSDIVAVVGPAGSREVEAVGPLFARAGMAFVSGSATKPSLTDGANPTFFRVVAADSLQGPEDAHFVIDKLHPKALMIIDDEGSYSTQLVNAMIPIFRGAGIAVDHESVSQKLSDFSSLVARITPHTSVVVLPWQVATNAQRFGKALAAQHKRVTIVATDQVYSPGSFTIPGSYISSSGPDITALRGDASLVAHAKAAMRKFGTSGPLVYAATHVVDRAIASVCRSGRAPSRSNVLPAIKATDEPTSILGQPIRFYSDGDLVNATWFLVRVNSAGQYEQVPNS
jgi:branched-chain amino acid transport system substrate-binding protein